MSQGQRRVVLTEEDYTSKLSSIVERDFFPEVQKLAQQNKLLDRRLEGDLEGAIQVRRETRQLLNQQEELNLRRLCDDYAITTNNGVTRKRPRPLHDESLTGFVARATNEDDHEFDSNQKRQVQANRERLRELFDPNNNHNNNKSNNNNNHNNNLLLELELASDDFMPESNRIEFQKPPARNSLFFNPTPLNPPSHAYNGTMKPHLLIKSDATNEKEDSTSSVMMPPPSKQQTLSVVEQKNAKRMKIKMFKTELVEYIPKHHLETKIQPSATRFPSRTQLLPTIGTSDSDSSSNGPLFDELDSASDYTTDYTSYTTDASTDLDAPLRSLKEERTLYQKQRNTQKQSRPYVAMTPQIIPGTAGNESPITTWGTIDGTPIVLSGRDHLKEAPSPFRIAENNYRESAANQADKIMAKRTKLAKKSNNHKSNKSKRRSCNPTNKSLTPAALSLLEKTKTSQSGLVSALRTSYTPRPSSRSRSSSRSRHASSSKTRRRDHAYNATPQL